MCESDIGLDDVLANDNVGSGGGYIYSIQLLMILINYYRIASSHLALQLRYVATS